MTRTPNANKPERLETVRVNYASDAKGRLPLIIQGTSFKISSEA